MPALVVAEATYLVGHRLGTGTEAAFVRGLAELEVEGPATGDWAAIADLVERYGEFPLGTTDASIAVLAERLGTDVFVTLDTRHFGALRRPSGAGYRLLPD